MNLNIANMKSKVQVFKSPIAEWKQLMLLIFFASVIIYWRNPLFFLLPRVFAEEPGGYLLNALKNSLPQSFGFTLAGYFSIIPNFASELAAKIFPLEYAGHVFTSVGLIVQLLTVVSIYYSIGRILPTRVFSATTALFILVIAKPETWLNTVFSMYWLSAGMFFLLNTKRISQFHILYSTLAFLTGPTSLIWLPFFGLRWFLGYDSSKRKEKRVGVVFGIGLIALAVNIYLSYLMPRTISIGSRLSLEMLRNLPRGFISMYAHLFASGGYPQTIVLLVIFVIGIVMFTLLRRSDLRFRIFTAGALLYYGFTTAILSFEMMGGNRYALPVTTGIFSLAVLGLATVFLSNSIKAKRSQQILFVFTIVFIMGNRLIEFHDFTGTYAGSNYVYDRNWPNWKEQILATDRSIGGEIKTFPQWAGTNLQGTDWAFLLPPKVGR